MAEILILDFLLHIAVSLGVGASTLAVLNYIVAAKDGTVDKSEQRLMRVVYTVLRIAMVIILVALITKFITGFLQTGSAILSGFEMAIWTVVILLYVNALLMTKRYMPRYLGPALQAGSWYMLSVLYFMASVAMTGASYTYYLIWYIGLVLLLMLLINGSFAYLKMRSGNKVK